MSHIRPLRSWMLTAILAAFLSACITNPVPERTEPKTVPTKKWNQGKARSLEPVPVDKLNSVAQAASKGGVVECVQRINQVTNFLTTNSQSGAFLFLAPNEPDRTMTSSSLEIRNGANSAYASASFAPAGSDGCGALYETVAYWNIRCEEVNRKAFSALRPDGALSRSIAMLDGGPTLRVFLMPTDRGGCISIKKEMVY